jgi:hypothetical protein
MFFLSTSDKVMKHTYLNACTKLENRVQCSEATTDALGLVVFLFSFAFLFSVLRFNGVNVSTWNTALVVYTVVVSAGLWCFSLGEPSARKVRTRMIRNALGLFVLGLVGVGVYTLGPNVTNLRTLGDALGAHHYLISLIAPALYVTVFAVRRIIENEREYRLEQES